MPTFRGIQEELNQKPHCNFQNITDLQICRAYFRNNNHASYISIKQSQLICPKSLEPGIMANHLLLGDKVRFSASYWQLQPRHHFIMPVTELLPCTEE